jgi:predicted regulator of Ras-like GTPase activity (Roadblock/LC7/MglB family)
VFEQKEQTLEALRAIILEDDRRLASAIEQEVAILKDELLDPAKFGSKVEPHTAASLDQLKQNFGTIFKDDLKVAVQRELKGSQDEVINALYPIIGKLIRKYIQTELEKLAEDIDNQISNTFDLDIWLKRIKAFFSGADQSSIILNELNRPQIEQIFLIQRGSGLLLASYSKDNLVDQDMIAGMLTAIKSFVEDAFQKGEQSLSTIEYESYKILLLDYHTFSLAFIVTGTISTDFKIKLSESSNEFVSLYMKNEVKEVSTMVQQTISYNLAHHFIGKDE